MAETIRILLSGKRDSKRRTESPSSRGYYIAEAVCRAIKYIIPATCIKEKRLLVNANDSPIIRAFFVMYAHRACSDCATSQRNNDRVISAVIVCNLLSGKRDSNPWPSAWEADALPLSYCRKKMGKLPSPICYFNNFSREAIFCSLCRTLPSAV